MEFSNPRNEATIENWPHGRQRVTAKFLIEKNNKGYRCGRVTTGKPKYTTYHLRMTLVDGDDGRIYALGLTDYGQVVVWDGTLKTNNYYYEGSPEYAQGMEILKAI